VTAEQFMVQILGLALRPRVQDGCVAEWLLGSQTSEVERNKPVGAVGAA